MSYEASLKQKRDWESVLATVRNAGRRELEKELEKERARAEAEKREVVRNLISKFENLSDDSIASIAVADVSLVADVRKELNKK